MAEKGKRVGRIPSAVPKIVGVHKHELLLYAADVSF
jgi:hypothetical protein